LLLEDGLFRSDVVNASLKFLVRRVFLLLVSELLHCDLLVCLELLDLCELGLILPLLDNCGVLFCPLEILLGLFVPLTILNCDVDELILVCLHVSLESLTNIDEASVFEQSVKILGFHLLAVPIQDHVY
jgi:hypothetical protein